jgi:hypothetical protein
MLMIFFVRIGLGNSIAFCGVLDLGNSMTRSMGTDEATLVPSSGGSFQEVIGF